MTYDVTIIGTGPAGMTAGLIAGRYGLETMLFERSELGGELVDMHTIEAYPGFPENISGPDLRSRMVEQLRQYDLTLRLSAVTSIEPGHPITVTTEDGNYESRSVIIAGGGSPKHASNQELEEYSGRGVFYCAQCDGPLYEDERVVILGGGERALMDAIYLSEFAAAVTVVEESSQLSAPETLRERVGTCSSIEVKYETEIVGVTGDGIVESATFLDKRSDTTYTEAADGVLVQLGMEPDTAYLGDAIELAESGHIRVDEHLETNISGVFAAGSIREGSICQVAAAVGDGVQALHSVLASLEER